MVNNTAHLHSDTSWNSGVVLCNCLTAECT